MLKIQGLYRYPIKGLSAQPLSVAGLEAGQPFPFDRTWALARPGSDIDGNDPKWAKKGRFLMLMLDEALAQVQTHLDVETLELTVVQDCRRLTFDLGSEAGHAAVESYINRMVPSLTAAPKLVRSRGGHFMDKPDAVISIINIETVRKLEAQWGVKIDPLRFRPNLIVENAEPWAEFSWVGHDLRIGGVVLQVDRRNGRCGATNVNPSTGERDLDIPGALRSTFGHKDLGVYAKVCEGGTIAVGDTVLVPDIGSSPTFDAAAGASQAPGAQYICGGCYFIYEENAGVPAQGAASSTSFLDLPATWVCKDCGADRGVFRPYITGA